MPLKLGYEPSTQTLTITAGGKLEVSDYQRLAPLVEDLITQHGKLDVLLILHEFKGWTAGALWEDVKFDVKHFRDIGKLAVVGEREWEKGMAAFCRPFTTAEIKFFERENLAEAMDWIGVRELASSAAQQ